MEDKDAGKKGFLHLRNPLKRERPASNESVPSGYTWDDSLKTENKSTTPKTDSASQVITLEPISDKNYGDSDFEIEVSSSSGLRVKLTASGVCSVTGTTVHINGAGVCTIAAHQDGDDDFNQAEDVQQTFTVHPAELTVTADNKRTEYGKPLPSFTATVSGLVNGFENLGTFTFTSTAVPGGSPGTYAITPSGLTSPNYTYNYVPGELIITPAKINVTVKNAGKIYGEALPAFEAAINGLINKDTPESLGELVFETDATPASPVGVYCIKASGLNSPNYIVNYTEGTLSVTPAELTVKANDKNIVYGEEFPVFDGEVTGLIESDAVESLGLLIYNAAAMPGSPVGEYAIIPSGLESPNYSCNYINGTLSISPAPLTVTVEDVIIEYGEALPVFDVAISGLVNGDTRESLGILSYDTVAEKGSPADIYEIIPSGFNSLNYIYNYVSGTLTINPAPLTVIAEDKIKVYGAPLPVFTASITGLVNGDTVESLGEISFTCDAGPSSPVGSYAITPGGLTSPNYVYEWGNGTLRITPAPLLVKADDKKMACNSSLPTFTATVSGLVNGDTLESTGTLIFSTTATQYSAEGTYTIAPSSLNSPNYTYNYISGLLTITGSAPQETGLVVRKEVASNQKIDTPRLGEVLVDKGLITPKDLVSALSKQLGVPEVDLNATKIEPESVRLVPESLARKYGVMPFSVNKGYLKVAMSDPTDIMAIEALSAHTKMRIRPMIALAEDIQKALDRNYKSIGELEKQFHEEKTAKEIRSKILDESIAEAPAVRSLEIILEEAVKNRASDIHIEPESTNVRIRYRIDGVMHEVAFLPLSAHGPLISRLKVLANMNIADHRPQDGQFNFKAFDKDVDMRVAVIATAYGEMGTLRLLDKSFAVRTLTEVGFFPENLKRYQKMLKSPYGMILLSGPTGSGKTTTLYASINSLNKEEMKIVTIEDPVEYHFNGVNQIQVNPRAGITFGNGLRAIMRHDPDVALVGEIRDTDTAAIAVQAAMTGHLVLASVHANDSVGVLFRLADLDVEPFLLASALVGVVAQRMVRKICPNCQTEMPASLECQEAYYDEIKEHRESFAYGKGCDLCANTGYLGRTAVMEILTVSDEIKRMLLTGASTVELRKKAIEEGMVPMRHDGMLKVKAGITTPDEILRNVFSL
ncbi:MAG: Flp pilus assembly complex ATPase component TadA [Dehalococcoidales bacterium]|nr:Flp pilus assembly complex ATPase component TadA [Dehalococcoidales bacterium]